MQKKLIAAAVATLISTGAMAQVTVYGRLDFGYNNVETDTTTAGGVTTTTKTTNTAFNQGVLTSSRLGFNISEDLGGGTSAFGNVELGINNLAGSGEDIGTDRADPFTTRTAFAGLKSDSLGALSIGRQTVLADLALQAGSANGVNNAIGDLYTSYGKLNNSRSSDLIQYASPSFAGFKFALQYGKGKNGAPGAVPADKEHEETGLLLSYTAGALNVTFGMSDEELSVANVVTSEPTQMALSGSYDFGVAKVYATYADGDNKIIGLDGRQAMELAVSVPIGATTLWASVFDGEVDNAGATADHDLSGFQLGAKYALSKRTSAYALYGTAKDETQNSAASTEGTQYALGVRHDF